MKKVIEIMTSPTAKQIGGVIVAAGLKALSDIVIKKSREEKKEDKAS